MYTIIAIEGIDRIGKSTFINELKRKLDNYITNCIEKPVPVVIEKPTIGINTLHTIGYPLANAPGIMEIRNIGLMEEFLYRCKIAKETDQTKIIIRDRFNLSEMAYGESYRKEHMARITGVENELNTYRAWNAWFENELDKVAHVINLTFVLDENSYPNEDEAISAKDLVKVNEKFKEVSKRSVFMNNFCIKLHKDPETGMTDIMEELPSVFRLVCRKTFNAILPQ